MKNIKKWLYITVPYFICVIAGAVLFVLSSLVSGNVAGLLLGMSGAFFAIPCLYVLYESALRFSNRKLNKELFGYAKMQIDREMLSVTDYLVTLIYHYDEIDRSLNEVKSFLKLSEHDIITAFQNKEYLGFQVLKDLSVNTGKIETVLENPFILERLDNNQVISVVTILRRLTSLEVVGKRVDDLYKVTDKKVGGYKVQAAKDMNPMNTEYPDRYLLFQHLSDDKYIAKDAGDFPLYQVPNLLNMCKVNDKYVKAYAHEIFSLITAINEWLKHTGSEFIIDPKMFKIVVSRGKEKHATDEN